jgi:hypothetical protein
MSRTRATITLALCAVLASLSGVFGLVAAHAAPGPQPVESKCTQAWYVNGDEIALMPEQVADGFLFDGPSLVHHSLAAPVTLALAPLNGAFTATLSTGVLPLFKMETLTPYSTINKTGAGKYWSSKIASGPGSQGAPVDTVAELAALAPYTAATTVFSFGVGYANDTGNKAIVHTVTFGGSKYDLKCAPPSESASATPSSSGVPSTSGSPAAGAGGDSLALTGAPVGLLIGLAVVLVVGGIGLRIVGRRRRRA